MAIAFIGIGSNLGDRQSHCREAVASMAGHSGIKVLAESKWRETEPLKQSAGQQVSRPAGWQAGSFWCVILSKAKNLMNAISCGRSFASLRMTKKVNHYINGVIKIETGLRPVELLKFLQGVEKGLGRVRSGQKWEDRTIDLDILFYDDIVMKEEGLVIPHPELHKRMFVLEPLCDIEPAFVHPVIGKNVEQLRSELTGDEAGSVR